MRITIFFPPGFAVEGIVLSARGDLLRVAVRGWDDVAEFRNREGNWEAENGDGVTIEPSPRPEDSPIVPDPLSGFASTGTVW